MEEDDDNDDDDDNVIQHKMYVMNFSTKFTWNDYHSTNNQLDANINVHLSSYIVPAILITV